MSNLNKFGITEAQMLALANKNGVEYRFGDQFIANLLAYSQELLSLAAPAVANAANSDVTVINYGNLPPLPEPLEIDWPELHSQALGCGVEDRNIHDRYEAAEYGWQDGVDKAVERVPEAIYDADQMQDYARAAVAHAAPNAQLVDALQGALSALEGVEDDRFNIDMDEVSMASSSCRAALASLPPQKEAL